MLDNILSGGIPLLIIGVGALVWYLRKNHLSFKQFLDKLEGHTETVAANTSTTAAVLTSNATSTALAAAALSAGPSFAAKPAAAAVGAPAPAAPAPLKAQIQPGVPLTSQPIDASGGNYHDPYPTLSIDQCVAAEKSTHVQVVALGAPGTNGNAPLGGNAGPYWGEKGVQASYHQSASQKRLLLGLPLTTLAQDLAS